MHLDHLAPGQLKEVRLNLLRNVVVIHIGSVVADEALFQVTTICGISVRPCIPRGTNTPAAMIRGVDADVTDEEFMKEISAPQKVTHVRRLGTSYCVNVVFTGDCLHMRKLD